MRADNLRAKENITPCKKEATFRDFPLPQGRQLPRLGGCMGLWPWGGLGRAAEPMLQDMTCLQSCREVFSALLSGCGFTGGQIYMDWSPSSVPSACLRSPCPSHCAAGHGCSEQSADRFLLKLQKAINSPPRSLASGAPKYKFTSPLGFFFFPFLKVWIFFFLKHNEIISCPK